MDTLILAIVGLGEAAIFAGLMYGSIAKRRGSVLANLEKIRAEAATREQLVSKVDGYYSQMVDINLIKSSVGEIRSLREALKSEHGKTTITQAELETVENRLRELEEIERELEASSIETKEELNILRKKEAELKNKNDALKAQIAASTKEMDKYLAEIEMSAQMQEQIQGIKTEILQTEERIDTMILQIEQGNEQYFILKQRYDALDIEYAQLFENFSLASEASRKDK